MPRRDKDAVFPTNLGLFLDRPPAAIPPRGLSDGLNFRITEGKLSALNLGWSTFGLFSTLSGPMTMIELFHFRNGGQVLILGTTKDIYKYDDGTELVAFLTPRYEAGTADPTNGSAVVVGALPGTRT